MRLHPPIFRRAFPYSFHSLIAYFNKIASSKCQISRKLQLLPGNLEHKIQNRGRMASGTESGISIAIWIRLWPINSDALWIARQLR
jgi:hypothetical protein